MCIAQRVCTPLLGKIKNDLHRCIQGSTSEDSTDESLTRLDPRFGAEYKFINKKLYLK
jgi:hypothetical protein